MGWEDHAQFLLSGNICFYSNVFYYINDLKIWLFAFHINEEKIYQPESLIEV